MREGPLDKIEEISYPLIIFFFLMKLCLQFVTHLFYDSFTCIILIIYILSPAFLKTRSENLKFPSFKILNLLHLPSTFSFSFKKYVGVSPHMKLRLALKLAVGCPVGKGSHCLINKLFG